MKLPSENEILKSYYSGSRDSQGNPHGYGVMEYYTQKGVEYKYEGSFIHGKRHGYGTWFALSEVRNPYEEWQWYMIGEYDSVGRLVSPRHEQGSYTKYIMELCAEYEGWWKDDAMNSDLSNKKTFVADFEIYNDSRLLKYFLDCRDIRRMSPSMVEKLRTGKNPYERYAYGQWLCRTQSDKKSLKTATECFRFASECGIADALQMLSHLYHIGEFYDESKDALVLDRSASYSLNAEAIRKGSVLAKIKKNYNLFYEAMSFDDKEAAIAEAEKEAKIPGSSTLWMEQLGWYYEDLERYDEAIEAYQKCIDEGLFHPLDRLATIYLCQGKTEYYKKLMNKGIKMNVSECMILGTENANEWDDLTGVKQREIRYKLKENLMIGIGMNCNTCIYTLAYLTCYGKMGFECNPVEGLKIAFLGEKLHSAYCCQLISDVMNDIELRKKIPEEMQMSKEEVLMMKLRSLRYGNIDVLDEVLDYNSDYIKLGFRDEIESVWEPLWDEMHDDDDDDGRYDAWA